MSTISVAEVTTENSTTPLNIGTGNSSAGFIKLEAANSDILLSGSVKFVSSGNVLIGRTDSTVGNNVKLDVNGAINASAVLINQTLAATVGKAIAMTIVFG